MHCHIITGFSGDASQTHDILTEGHTLLMASSVPLTCCNTVAAAVNNTAYMSVPQ